MNTMWGIHNDALGTELVEKGFVSIGWEKVPDVVSGVAMRALRLRENRCCTT